MPNQHQTILRRSATWQILSVMVVWAIAVVLASSGFLKPNFELTLSVLVAVPAAVFAVANLYASAQIQRSAYVKDYALKFRTDKELSESFYYLVMNFGNKNYDVFVMPEEKRTPEEKKQLEEAQKGLTNDLKFFHPDNMVGMPQERRLDNLLGFFDSLGYDYCRGLISLRDIAGMFGLQLEHLNQRKAIQGYIDHVRHHWSELTSFTSARTPYTYLHLLLTDYKAFCETERKRQDDTHRR